MSLIWADGFENASLWSRKYTLAGGTTPSASTARNGNGALLTGSGTPGSITWAIPSAGQHATIIMGFAFKAGSTGFPSTTAETLFRLGGDSGATSHTQGFFSTSSGGTLTVTRGPTTLATSSFNFATEAWYYLEVKATLGDGTAGRVYVNVNGVQIIDTGGTDTKNAGTASVYDSIRLGARGGTGTILIDDWYVCNGAGSVYNDFLGDVTIETLRPNANGNHSQWVGSDSNSTDNYLLVDEATYDAADYIESSTTNNKDTFGYGNLTAASGAVKGVVVNGVAQKTASGAQNLRQIARIGGSDYNGSSVALDTSDLPRTQVWEQSPATSSDWTISEVNGAEFGVEVL